jgi:hypothetical protein
MRTTLNIPDHLVRTAKLRALQEGTTLTELLVQGLQWRLEKAGVVRALPVSRAGGGLCPGGSWDDLDRADQEDWR